MALSTQYLLESPDIYPQRIEGDDLIFVKMSRVTYGRSIFTDQSRIRRAGDDIWAVPLDELMVLIERSGASSETPGFIFHVAHCGSTLLSRALDQPGNSLVVREPFVLRQLATILRASEGQSAAFRRGLRSLMFLLGRQYAPSERTLIKANVPVNFMLDEIIQIAPNLQGVLLFAPLSEFILSVMKTEQRGAWVQHVSREMASFIHQTPQFEGIEFESLTIPQAACVLWLSQMKRFEAVANGNPKLCYLNCNRFYEHPVDTVTECAAHLNIDISRARAKKIVTGQLFHHHAKSPDLPYSDADRRAENKQLSVRFEREVRDALEWSEMQGFDLASFPCPDSGTS